MLRSESHSLQQDQTEPHMPLNQLLRSRPQPDTVQAPHPEYLPDHLHHSLSPAQNKQALLYHSLYIPGLY